MNARLIITLLIGCAGAPGLGAQAVGPVPDSAARAYYAERQDEYAAERRAIADAGRQVSRTGGVLRLRLASGRVVTFSDTLQEGDSHHRFVYLGRRRVLGLHLVELRLYEGSALYAFHDRTGQEELIAGAPLVSPDGRRFVSASLDLEAGYDPNRLEIWRVDPDGLHCEAALDGQDKWGPDSVAWVGPTAVRFARIALDERTLERRSAPERLVRAGAGWVLASSPGRRLTRRCS